TVFSKKLSIDHRTWAKELVGVRNKLAHIGGTDFSDDDTWRALDTMSRLCDQIDPESAEGIRGMLRTLRYGSSDGSTAVKESVPAPNTAKDKKAGILSETPALGLPSWRDVIEPHPDVAQGRYKNAEFAYARERSDGARPECARHREIPASLGRRSAWGEHRQFQ
ncbi:MAG: hypothetical protein LBT23_03875, partial [Synergistaceae bacterium]|nr:hypothetical protein [Synergistaceae bacterium]